MMRQVVRPGGRWSARGLVGVAVALLGLVLAFGAPAYAAAVDVPNGHAQAGAAWGDPCETVGATANGGRLVCAKAPGDGCPRWHSAQRHGSGGGWVRPSTPPCSVCASPSSSPSTTSAASPSPSVVPSTGRSVVASASASAGGAVVVSGSLPVTGAPAGATAAAGVVLLVLGVALVRPWRRRQPLG